MATVLVVDDVADARQLLARLLKYSGYDAICAASGEEALRLVRGSRPDLMLLDLNMPGMDGFEVLEALNALVDAPAPPVIMLTAMADPALIQRAKSLGAKDYFVKAGFDVSDMLDRIAEHVGTHVHQ